MANPCKTSAKQAAHGQKPKDKPAENAEGEKQVKFSQPDIQRKKQA